MKRKPQSGAEETVVSPEIIERARLLLEPERVKGSAKCSVCGSDAAPNGSEPLCWVCRRLKISAWRDVEQQAPVQE